MNARITDTDARRQLELGNPLAAADVYSKRALRVSDPAVQQDYLLIASEILFDRGLMEQAQEKLSEVPIEVATLDLAHRRDILLAKSFIFDRDAEAALAALPDPIEVDSALNRGRVFETQAQAYEILQDPDNELIARINLENQLSNPETIERSHQQIWRLLSTQSLSTLRTMTTNVRGDTYQGWIELALAHAGAGMDAQMRQTSVNNWQQRFPAHPANPVFVSALYSGNGFDTDTRVQTIDQIAVLLPLSGRNTAVVAGVIRDGLMAAHQQANNTLAAPVLRFYDVGDNPGYVRTAYKNAVEDGADAVIGPLTKEAVAAVVSQQDIPVPTVTLNTVETAAFSSDVSNVIQFGLAPEDEAVAAASRAAGLGLTNAIVFQTDDSRGDREARAFRDAMFLYGGDVVHVAVLPTDTYDYSAQIKEALAIDESDGRFRTLSATIGKRLFFEPSIRNDVNIIFLAVTNEQARSVRTQLDFFYARQLPRLGTSRVAGIDDDQKKNADLNTIYYPDAPWVLRSSLNKDPLKKQILASFDNADGVYGKLYALGADAYSIVTNLDKISAGERLMGYTGDLELRSDGRIQRYLDWAQYVEGVSQNVKSVDAPSLPLLRPAVIN
ncbi:MAG: penicillin-binding protein activator [Granulosicoccus sp.]